ncbi:hypothetical protein [Curvibacter sp. PAE-UM]|uniref:hypothetical protein n=1 Tax=Curvibacter sp. PAE-UM TaxID=1714344 RepID=UPI000A7BB7C3|nr:hypothetical protein [Curvibacter sp. PAE-UM]
MKTILFILLLAGYSCAFSASADSKPRADSHAQQTAPKEMGAKAAVSLLGTDKNPFIVKRIDDVESPEKIAQQEQDRLEKASNERAIVTWTIVMAIASLLLAIVASVQLGMFLTQLRLMKAGAEDTKNAAFAAKAQSDALMAAERAYVKISHAAPGITPLTAGFSNYIEFEIKNWGKTPAHVTDVHIGFKLLEYGEALPIPYPFGTQSRESFPNAFLVSDESIYIDKHVSLDPLSDTSKQLWVFGHVDYIDAFNRRWRGGYARKFVDSKDNNLAYNTEARDNFDRERVIGEGDDWNK